MRFGKTLVVEEADSIEPLMYPLLSEDMQGPGAASSVRIGDRLVEYNKDFRLILVTRASRPQLAVDAAALLIIVNFTVTRLAHAADPVGSWPCSLLNKGFTACFCVPLDIVLTQTHDDVLIVDKGSGDDSGTVGVFL